MKVRILGAAGGTTKEAFVAAMRKRQRELPIQQQAGMGEGMTIMGIPSNGGLQEAVCLPLKYLNGWLFKVNANRYRGERREAVMLYQGECFEALFRYWNQGGTDVGGKTSELYRTVEAKEQAAAGKRWEAVGSGCAGPADGVGRPGIGGGDADGRGPGGGVR